MTYKKAYTISTETAAGAVDPGTLHKEIQDLNIAGFIGTRPGGPDQVLIEFVSQPSAGEETSLTAVVAAHQGQKIIFNPFNASDDQDSFTNSSEYATKTTITLPPGAASEIYVIKWYCESYSSPSKFRTLYRVQNITDNQTLAEASAPRGITSSGNLAWLPISGFAFVTPDPNSEKTIAFQFRTDNARKRTAKIRRARLMYELEAV